LFYELFCIKFDVSGILSEVKTLEIYQYCWLYQLAYAIDQPYRNKYKLLNFMQGQ